MLPKNRKKHSSLLTFFSGPQSYSWCCFTAYVKVFPFKKLRSSLTVRWTWMAGKTAEPLTTCSRLSTVHQANSASKNKQLNFCWNKNGRVWNSSLPSDTGSLIFINGSWNSPRLPLHCGKNVAWSRQCHLQVSRRTRLIGLLTPSTKSTAPGCLCGLSFLLGTYLLLLATVHSGKHTESF